jgi:D-3-phosphoglycerate dehydrogenase
MTANLKNCRVLVTPTSFGANDPALRAWLEDEVGEVDYNTGGKPLRAGELRGRIAGVDGYIAGLDEIDRSVIEAADRLKVIARYGVGYDNIDVEAAREKGVVVTNAPGANAASVAELAIGLMIALMRNITQAVEATKAGGWPRLKGISLEGARVGLVGFGAIGRETARRLEGFGCEVMAYDPAIDEAAAEALGVEIAAYDDVIREADVLSLHAPLTPETHHMVDADLLSRMKPGAILVNTARGGLIDEGAVLTALESGQLGGVALDVFAQQPPDPDNPLLAHPKVIATPHMGSHSNSAANAMGRAALHDCLAVLRGDEPLHRVV